jgi:NAD(P)H-dependent FMN reductase
MKKILGISGSTRGNSSNEAILKNLATLCRDSLDLDIYTGVDRLPHFNPDLDTDDPPAAVRDLRERIAAADGIVICTPEYVFSLPGSLKNAIDWNVSTVLFSGKPVAIIVAAASGLKALESLELIMTTIEARIAPASKLLIQGAKGKLGPDGAIADRETLDRIRALAESLLQSIEEGDA